MAKQKKFYKKVTRDVGTKELHLQYTVRPDKHAKGTGRWRVVNGTIISALYHKGVIDKMQQQVADVIFYYRMMISRVPISSVSFDDVIIRSSGTDNLNESERRIHCRKQLHILAKNLSRSDWKLIDDIVWNDEWEQGTAPIKIKRDRLHQRKISHALNDCLRVLGWITQTEYDQRK